MAKQSERTSDEELKNTKDEELKKPELPIQDEVQEQTHTLTLPEEEKMIEKELKEVKKKNIDSQRQIIQETDELAAEILKASYEMHKQSEIGSVKADLDNLRTAINALRTMTTLPQPKEVNLPAPHQGQNDCGCGDVKEKKCCIELYGSGVRVIKAADGLGGTLELILAIQAAGIKAVFPGLTSQINVNKNVGWVKVDWPITRVCVPCNQTMNIPLLVEAMDIDKALSVPEKGANTGSISISCSCNPNSVVVDVNLSSGSILGGEKKGQIMVEVSARRVNGECCC